MKENRVKNKNTSKKCDAGLISLWIFIGILFTSLVAIIIALCVFHSGANFVPKRHHAKKEPVSTSQVTTADGWNVMEGTKLIQKIAKQDDFILYITESNCAECQKSAESLKNVLAEVKNPELYYFDIAKNKEDDYILKNLKVAEVPTLLYIKDGEVYDRLDSWQDLNSIRAFVVKYNQ